MLFEKNMFSEKEHINGKRWETVVLEMGGGGGGGGELEKLEIIRKVESLMFLEFETSL